MNIQIFYKMIKWENVIKIVSGSILDDVIDVTIFMQVQMFRDLEPYFAS